MTAKEYLNKVVPGLAFAKTEEEAVEQLIIAHQFAVAMLIAFSNIQTRLWFFPRFLSNWIVFGTFKEPNSPISASTMATEYMEDQINGS